MRLDRILERIDTTAVTGEYGVEVTGVAVDSREVSPGCLFIAVRGHAADGHRYIEQAVSDGACAVIAEQDVDTTVPVVVVEDSRRAASRVARIFFGEPDLRLSIAGITGTNGKTSTAFLLQSIMEDAAGPCGIIGTVGQGVGGDMAPALQTTPGPVELFGLLSAFVEAGCGSAVMEVSSHAAVQGRVEGIEFDVGVFTNITRDHLDYHETFERYLDAKEVFIRSLSAASRKKEKGAFVYNLDDERLRPVAERYGDGAISFGRSGKADFSASEIKADLGGTRFRLSSPSGEVDISMSLLGGFTVYNALAAAAAASAMSAGLDRIKEGLERVDSVPGRFEVIRGGGRVVIVDYAHTPDALENLLEFCRELGPRRLVTVFGCGGDRDRGKRPEMGAIAGRLSDRVIVTSDNPRSEDPSSIIDEVMTGFAPGAKVEGSVDRAAAIRSAIEGSMPGDLVVIAGKGHEDYQVLGEEKIHFSDTEQASEVLRGLEV